MRLCNHTKKKPGVSEKCPFFTQAVPRLVQAVEKRLKVLVFVELYDIHFLFSFRLTTAGTCGIYRSPWGKLLPPKISVYARDSGKLPLGAVTWRTTSSGQSQIVKKATKNWSSCGLRPFFTLWIDTRDATMKNWAKRRFGKLLFSWFFQLRENASISFREAFFGSFCKLNFLQFSFSIPYRCFTFQNRSLAARRISRPSNAYKSHHWFRKRSRLETSSEAVLQFRDRIVSLCCQRLPVSIHYCYSLLLFIFAQFVWTK